MKRLLVILCLSVPFLAGTYYPLTAQVPVFQGTSAPVAFDIRRNLPQQVLRNDYALFIANSKYDDPRFVPLPNCVLDAEEIEKTLRTKFGYITEVRKNLAYVDFESKLGEYINRTWKENDQLLIYISGHGEIKPTIKQGFFIMKDSDKRRQSQYFSFPSLQSILKELPCKHILLVLDVCYGGMFDDNPKQEMQSWSNPISPAPSGLDESHQTEYVLEKLRPRTRILLASGDKEPVREGLKGEHSPFAKALLDKLGEIAAESGKIVTVYELSALLKQDVSTVVTRRFEATQSDSNFLFISK